MDVTVGESIVLPCQVSHDHSLDIMFTWSFNGHLIDFEKDGDHFERVGGVSINSKQSPQRVPLASAVAEITAGNAVPTGEIYLTKLTLGEILLSHRLRK